MHAPLLKQQEHNRTQTFLRRAKATKLKTKSQSPHFSNLQPFLQVILSLLLVLRTAAAVAARCNFSGSFRIGFLLAPALRLLGRCARPEARASCDQLLRCRQPVYCSVPVSSRAPLLPGFSCFPLLLFVLLLTCVSYIGIMCSLFSIKLSP